MYALTLLAFVIPYAEVTATIYPHGLTVSLYHGQTFELRLKCTEHRAEWQLYNEDRTMVVLDRLSHMEADEQVYRFTAGRVGRTEFQAIRARGEERAREIVNLKVEVMQGGR